MREYLTLGPTPVDEKCAQMGRDDFWEESEKECKRYIELLKKKFGKTMPYGCSFRTKSFDHDFGMYREVCVFYDDEDNVGLAFALHVEGNLPQKWTDDEEIPFEVPERETEPGLDMEELEEEASRILDGEM